MQAQPSQSDDNGDKLFQININGSEWDGDTLEEESSETEEAAEKENEPIETEEKEELFVDFIGLNIDELYSAVLYETIHMVGSEAEACDKSQILQYLKEVFNLNDTKHETLLEAVKAKEAPNIILNVEIIKATDLKPKDPNGLSDPFCTVYLSSSSAHKYHTSVKLETLGPVWKEYFSLPVENMSDDSLCLEIWDFDPAETIKEKVTKIPGVKGIKGLSRLMKEIALTASTGKHGNELIGTAQIKLKSIPSYGQTRWIELEKRPKSAVQGNLNLKMNFSSHKNQHVACQEYRHILRFLLLHELQNNKTEEEEWNGKLSDTAISILHQHSLQSGLNCYHENMAHWVEFTKLHSNHHLSFMIFANLIEPIATSIKEMEYSVDELKLFWEGSKKLLPTIFTHIKNLKKINVKNKRKMEETVAALKILGHLCKIKLNDEIDLFSRDIYGWLNTEDSSEKSIENVVEHALREASTEWFQQNLDANEPEDGTTEKALKQAIKVTQIVWSDLQNAVEHYDKLFFDTMEISYSKLVYSEYEEKVYNLVEPLVNQICSSMKPIKLKQNMAEEDGNDDAISSGTSLFELYLILQRFALLATEIFREEGKDLKISNFHSWFYHSVGNWLDIATHKTMGRIDKAIELDKFVPVDDTVKYSSSSLDTLSTFYQIKVFWNQLAWPDIEGTYSFVAKLLDDLCRCCIYYADNIATKLEKIYESNILSTGGSNFFSVTNEWCLVVNNIDYITQSVQPFAKDLGVESIVKKLADFKNTSTAETCNHTLNLLMENTTDILTNKTIDLLETISCKMAHPVKQMLFDVCNSSVDQGKNTDVLMQYLDNNLMILHSQLNTVNFQKILSIIWQRVIKIIGELISEGLQKKKPVYFFKNMDNTVDTIKAFFQGGDTSLNTDKINKVKEDLYIYGLETEDLIHEYYFERVELQKSLSKATHGMLTVKVYFLQDNLMIDVLNARNIPPHDSNGFCDPYVKIVLRPKDKFEHQGQLRTKTQKKTLFPIFEETFSIKLKPEDRLIKTAILHFIVKDQDFIYFNQFVGEAFIRLSEVTSVKSGQDEINQTHLILNKPTTGTRIMNCLDMRHGDKVAKDFIKKQKIRMVEDQQ